MIKYHFKSYLLTLTLLLMIHSNILPNESSEMKIIKSRIITPLLKSTKINDKKINVLQDTLKKDGSWETVNYKDDIPASWKTIRHLKNIEELTFAYKAPPLQIQKQN